MYEVNGDFGEVRLASGIHLLTDENMFGVSLSGWHKCNDKYRIDHNSDGVFLITVSGCGSFVMEGEEYKLTPGTIAYSPMGISCSYKTPQNGLWEFYWLLPAGAMSHQFLARIMSHGKYVSAFDPSHDYGQRIEEIMNLSNQSGEVALTLSMKLGALFHLAVMDLCDEQAEASLAQKAVQYIEKHFREKFTLEDMAKSLYVSKEHMIRVFKKEIGLTPRKYLERYRLSSALQLLKFSSMQVKEIARQVGFCSSSHFINCFEKEYGYTPSAYRKAKNRFDGIQEVL